MIDYALLGLLAVTALALLLLRDLVAVVMLSGIYSLLTAALFVVLDAVDVAFTEAAVGAGVSTILMLATLALVGSGEKQTPQYVPAVPLVVVLVTGAALIFGTLDMPPFGHIDNPVQQHVAPYYLKQTPVEIGVPNVVTAVLASYRGYDTMGEVVVIFTAGIGVLMVLRSRHRRSRKEEAE